MWVTQWEERKQREAEDFAFKQNLEKVYMSHFDPVQGMEVRIGDAYQVRAQPQLKDHGWIDPQKSEIKVFKGILVNIATEEKSPDGSYHNDDLNRYTSIFKEAAIESVLANLRLEIKDYIKNFRGE